MRTTRTRGLVLAAAFLTLLVRAPDASARVRLENICSIYGQKEIKLTGIGLVIGLNGTGDGGDNLPAMRALASALRVMNSPVLTQEELRKNGKNVAMVLIEATIPRSGLRRGQKIDCYVSSPFSASDLTGGRLLVSPVQRVGVSNGPAIAVGLASGALVIEKEADPLTGKIPGGVVLEEDFVSEFIDKERGHIITLLLDAAHSSFHSASEVARVVNEEFKFENVNQLLARAVAPGVIEVQVPKQYYDSPVEFVAQMMEIGIDNPHTQAKVVVNPKTETVIVTGEVEISPVVISHNGLSIAVGGPPAPGGTTGSFVPVPPVIEEGPRQSPQQLRSLVEALDQLRVPTSDIIDIIRALHRSGKLHAEYHEE
jgi:flagellar P-ring protein precursor FlgI